MVETIKINAITSMAMTEELGLELRRQIESRLKEGKSVCLDFEGVEFFATPFFNSSIGYFVMTMKPEGFKEKIDVINLSELGEETYKHSYQNAISVLKRKVDLSLIGQITSETIAEQ